MTCNENENIFVLERYNRYYSTIFNKYKKWLHKSNNDISYIKMYTGVLPST